MQNRADQSIDFENLFAHIAGPIEIAQSKSTQEALNDFIVNYPMDEQWRLFVDGLFYATINSQNLTDSSLNLMKKNADPMGWVEYEKREPGCMIGNFLAWQFCLHEIKKHPERTDVTVEFIKKLHELVNLNVVNTNIDYCGNTPGEFRHEISCLFGFFLSSSFKYRYTEKGLRDLINNVKEKNLQNAEFVSGIDIEFAIKLFIDDSRGFVNLMYQPPKPILKPGEHKETHSRIFFHQLVKNALDNFNTNIIHANTDNHKLELIAKTIEHLERIHPFMDANGRVFVNLLLNYLLIKEGFPPATLLEPNVFDAFGHHADVLKNGIANTQKIYHGCKNLFGFTVSNPESIAKMKKITDEANKKFTQLYPDITHKNLFKHLQTDLPSNEVNAKNGFNS